MSLIETIINKSNLAEYIMETNDLKTNDYREWRGCCSLHGGTNETSLTAKNNFWYCFACGKGGNIINWEMEKKFCDYYTAVENLAEYYNISINDTKYQNQKKAVTGKEVENKKYKGDLPVVEDYLIKERGFNEEIIRKMEFGFDGERLTIPVRDDNSKLVAFSRRRLDNGKPKYINEKNSDVYEKGSILYNFYNAKQKMKDRLYVCEGYLDAASGEQQNIPCVAYCGSEITKDHIMSIMKYADKIPGFTIYLAADNDEEGQRKVPKMRDKFKQYIPNVTVRVVVFPEGIKDFNDCLINDIDIKSLPSESIDLFVLRTALEKMETQDQQYNYVEDFIHTVKNPMIRGDIAYFLSTLWNQPAEQVRTWLNGAKNTDGIRNEFKLAEDALLEYRDLIGRGSVGFGIPSFDYAVNKIRKTEVVIITGYAGVAKTWVATEAALHLAIREKKNVIFFSLEMSAASLYERFIASFLGVSAEEVERLVREGDEKALKVAEALEKRLYVVDTAGLSMEDIQDRITFANTRVFTESPCDVIIIDYLQYMRGMGTYEELSVNVRKSKELAKKNNIVFILLCQLNRQGNQHTKPTLNMIRGAGDIEATGDIIIGVSAPGKDPSLSLEEKKKKQDSIIVNVMKARRGTKAEEIEMVFIPNKSRLREVVKE